MVIEVTIKEVEYLAVKLAQEILEFDEPIPDFYTRFPNKLESCLAAPFMRLSVCTPYPSLLDKASALFYFMIKSHPFANGNKRIAVTTLMLLLVKNNKWIKVDAYTLYRFTLWIAESPAVDKDDMINLIKGFLKKHVVNKD